MTIFAGYGGAQVTIKILKGTRGKELIWALAHEGAHAFQYQEFAKDLIEASRERNDSTLAYGGPTDLTEYERENLAYHVTAATAIALGERTLPIGGHVVVQNGRVNQAAIDDLLRQLYRVTPDEPGPRISTPTGYLWWGSN